MCCNVVKNRITDILFRKSSGNNELKHESPTAMLCKIESTKEVDILEVQSTHNSRGSKEQHQIWWSPR